MDDEEPNCNEIDKSIKYMKKIGIKSKLAMYYILMACKSESKIGLEYKGLTDSLESYYYGYKRSLKTISNRWLEEVSKMGENDRDAKKYILKKEQNTYFALSVLYDLQYERGGDKNEMTSKCPYTPMAKNFIQTIIETNKCLCLCYTNYVLAAAEEYGYKLIKGLLMSSHIYLGIIDDEIILKKENDNEEYKITPLLSNFPSNLNIKITNEGSIPTLYCTFDSGFRKNSYIDIVTTEKKVNFQKKYTKNFPAIRIIDIENDRRLNIKTQFFVNKKYEDGDWGIITSLLYSIPKKERMYQKKFDYFIYVINQLWGEYFTDLVYMKQVKSYLDFEKVEGFYINKFLNNITERSKNIGVYPSTSYIYLIISSILSLKLKRETILLPPYNYVENNFNEDK